MIAYLKKTFTKMPFFIKKILINAEAYRRDYFRRYGNYEKDLAQIDLNYLMNSGYITEQKILLDELFKEVPLSVPFYYKYTNLKNLYDLPVITKKDLLNNYNDFISKDIDLKKCFKSTTSGSTGTPLSYYQDRQSVRLGQLYSDKFLEYAGLEKNDRKARISGVNIIPFEAKNPPYWIYIDKYHQLQCSAYHFTNHTYPMFIDAMKRYNVVFGTGYATAWYFLAEYILESGIIPPRLKAIVSDSEGINKDQQMKVEKAFQCKMYQTYGLSEIGQVAFQCRIGNYHIVPSVCIAEVLDNDLLPVENGVEGQIVLTSLISKQTPLIRYATGDLGILGYDECICGWKTQYLAEIKGRLDDYVITPDGRKIGRLSHIIKPAIGVLESQLIQTERNELLIKIVPDTNFIAESMKKVIENAKNYLGGMNIKWMVVNDLERTANGKLRHVIRNF